MSSLQITYKAEPTAALFHADQSFVRAIMGPIGSGKSVACTVEILMKGLAQSPSPDGVRRTRWAVMRNTYPELKSTTIKTFQDWFPESIAPINWGTPITAKVKVPDLGDGTSLEIEVIFLALDRPADVKKLLSLELTGAWLNEAREFDKSIVDAATGRVGRYPSKQQGGADWSGIIMDTNPPDELHWWYHLAEEDRPDGWRFFQQPPSLLRDADGKYVPNPAAETVSNHALGYDYWLRQIPGKDLQWINVYVMGLYGSSMAGKPVFGVTYNDTLHSSPHEYQPILGHDIYLGWDFGLNPSCVIAQVTPHGQLRILDEYIADGTAIRQFAENVVLPVLGTKYAGCSFVSVGDPAGNQRAQTDEQTVFKELAELGIPTEPCSTNDPRMRIEAVNYFLGRLASGQPAFLLNPTCKLLRKGFNGGYRYRQLNVSGDVRYTDKPEKNYFSHIHDALQYLCVYLKEGLVFADNNRPVGGNVASYQPAGIGGY